MTKSAKRKNATPSSAAARPSSAKPATVRERPRAVEDEHHYPLHHDSPRGRRPVNLTLDRDAVERGERFANRHGVSVSTLVSGFLQSLPDEDSAAASFSPAVKRLYEVAAGRDFSRDLHREFLANKYGVK